MEEEEVEEVETIEDFWSQRGHRRDDRVWEFRNYLELVKEQGLGRKDSTQQEAGDLSTDRQKEP